jgi:hypothetical protein
MIDTGDYESDMSKTGFSDLDVERLLSGQVPDSPELIKLAPFVEKLRGHGLRAPDEAKMMRYSAEAAVIARATRATEEPTRSGRPVQARRSFSPRFAVALGAVLLLTGMSGVAVASDESAPGDVLYGLDRALENFGVGAGGAGERLEEASVMANSGKAAEALAHAAEAMAQDANPDAADALLSAAERIRGLPAGGDNAAEVRSQVADMLEWIAAADVKGKEFGQGVAERARGVGGHGLAGQGSQKSTGNNGANGKGPPDGVPPVTPGNSGG